VSDHTINAIRIGFNTDSEENPDEGLNKKSISLQQLTFYSNKCAIVDIKAETQRGKIPVTNIFRLKLLPDQRIVGFKL
jgi:hypothetical protein